MKRDWELVRSILGQLETLDPDNLLRAGDVAGADARVAGADARIAAHHFQLLFEAGLIDVLETTLMPNGGYVTATRLTWDGHEFLDNIRSDTIWNKVKDRISREGVGWTFAAIKLIASRLVLQTLGV